MKLNELVAKQYIDNLKELKTLYGLDGEIDIRLVSSMPDVMKAVPDVENEDEVAEVIGKAVMSATDNLDKMRAA